MSYYPQRHSITKVKIFLDSSNYATKLYDLNIGKLKTVLIDLKILSDVLDNIVVENTKFDRLKTKKVI